jgi:SOS response associated peptidase (SRAP)
MINARAETISEKPSYRRLIATKRCLIPADGFYEWRNLREGEARLPMKTECQLVALLLIDVRPSPTSKLSITPLATSSPACSASAFD